MDRSPIDGAKGCAVDGWRGAVFRTAVPEGTRIVGLSALAAAALALVTLLVDGARISVGREVVVSSSEIFQAGVISRARGRHHIGAPVPARPAAVHDADGLVLAQGAAE